MGMDEPSRETFDRFHQRILDDEITAFAELCEVALPYLVVYLRRSFPQVETHLHETIAIDCLLEYKQKPQNYDPAKASLVTYLKMAARKDLLNAIDKEKRRQGHLYSYEEYILQDPNLDEDRQDVPASFNEWLQENTSLSLSELLDDLNNFLDGNEKQVLLLMLDGIRETDRYAEVMQLERLDSESRRAEVKRAKDRLLKKLRRYGKSINNT
jgi:RNA polymerase sigma-70 factor (ECF subfamily)